MRKRIFEIVEVGKEEDVLSRLYDIFMIAAIVISLVPLMSKESNTLFDVMDTVTVIIFIADYLMRFITADYKLKDRFFSFIRYPFTFMALIDLLSILPSVIMINQSLKLLKVFRLLRALRVFRVFKGFRYSKNITIIINVFKRQKDSLEVVGVLALGYILITALIIFNVEPDTFETFFDAVYWSTISLTTVGYGDLYATSTIGQIITMVSALFGIAIVALPAGIITAGYMDELDKK